MEPGNLTILVVDDDEFIRGMLSAWLEYRGYQVVLAHNGQEALLLRKQRRFDLILLDIMMPEVDGYEVLRQIKADGDTTPVIVMSALDDVNSVIECIKLGAEDYLSKPIEVELLWARITSSLDKKLYRDLQQAALDELNLLQEIDQQLNTTLKREEASQLALQCARQKTNAVAGVIGSLDGNYLILRASFGLGKNPAQNLALVELEIEPDQREIVQKAQPENGHGRLNQKATHRISVPIVRNSIINDRLILDVVEPVSEGTVRFLKRLGIHTAIALHNAQLYADVQAANEAKSNFVAMVSHELKNPLTAIQAYTHLMRRQIGSMPDEQQEEYLGIIYDGSMRIHNLALELDDITQMETGQFKLNLEAVSLQTILEDLVKLMGSQIAAKKQHFILDFPPNLPHVWADAKRLSQILANLISNASKYTLESGQITVSARPNKEGEASALCISVTDTGIGIAPENQTKIFSQFFRADDEYVNSERGTGLGLHITKKLVELQGGEIGFSSKHKHGSTFHFTIPLAGAKV